MRIRFEPPDIWPGFADLFAGFALIVCAYSLLVPITERREQLDEDARYDRIINRTLDSLFADERRTGQITVDTTAIGHARIQLPGRITFDRGESDLKPGARDVLQQLAPLFRRLALSDIPRFYVVGYADTARVRTTLAHDISNNLELSARRATEAVKFLTGAEVGLPESLMVVSAAGANDPWRTANEIGGVGSIDVEKSRRLEIEILYARH